MRKLSPIESLLLSILCLVSFMSAFTITFFYGILPFLQEPPKPVANVYWVSLPLFILSFMLYEIVDRYGLKEERKE